MSIRDRYPLVMAMKGVGASLGPQLMAEIGDVSRFTHKGAITAFAGVDPGVNESGSYEQKSVPTSKRGSSDLRKTLFQVMDVLIKTHPQDDPVYQFLDKKRAQGKPYYVYMTAGEQVSKNLLRTSERISFISSRILIIIIIFRPALVWWSYFDT